MTDGLGWLSDRQRDGGIDRIPLPEEIRGELWLCGKHAIARRYGSGEFDTVVVLVEPHELEGHYDDYVRWLDAARDRVIRHPIHDLHAPTLAAMTALVDRIIERLDAGDRVVMHCAAGMGRAGTTAACVLISTGFTAAAALAAVAAARPGAGPEAGVQRDLVTEFARSPS
jgi:hypothetical protein